MDGAWLNEIMDVTKMANKRETEPLELPFSRWGWSL